MQPRNENREDRLDSDSTRTKRRGLLILILVAGTWAVWSESVRAGEPTRPNPPALRVHPAEVHLSGPDSVQQLVVDGLTSDRAAFDITRELDYKSDDPAVATVNASGTISAHADGATFVTIQRGDLRVRVPIKVSDFTIG